MVWALQLGHLCVGWLGAIKIKYEQYVPVLSFCTEKVKSLCAVGKVREGTIGTTQVSNCVVEIQIIVHTLKRPNDRGIPFTLGLCNGWRADVPIFPPPSEMEITKYVKYTNINNMENYKSYMSNNCWVIVMPSLPRCFWSSSEAEAR